MDTRYPVDGQASSEKALKGFAYQKEKAFLLKDTSHLWLEHYKRKLKHRDDGMFMD